MSIKTLFCGLLGFPYHLLQSIATEEVARSLGVRLVELDRNGLEHVDQPVDLLALFVTNDTYFGSLELMRSCKAKGGYFLNTNFILVSPADFNHDLADAWHLGMHAYVPVVQEVDSLYYALNNFARNQREFAAMDRQLKEASDIALLSMSASSQLGDIVRFMEKSYLCEDYEGLAQLLHETLESMGLSSCGVIRSDDGLVYFGDPDKKLFLQRLIKDHQSRGKFVDVENRTTVNLETLSVMARNLPEPGSEPYGRMKDVLFSLVEGADARIKAISTTRAAAVMDRTKLNFLAVMSHELRTPMNSVLGFASRLAKKQVGDVFTERDISALSFLQENARRMLDMIDKIFELTRVDSNIDRVRKRLLVAEVLTGLIRKYEDYAKGKGLVFETQWQDRGIIAEVDQRRLQQIVSNLLENAVRFTKEGAITVNIAMVKQPGRGDMLQIMVHDTGIGVSDEAQATLFKPFGNIDDYLSRGTSGTGLGLAIVKKFVVDLGGEIEFNSTLGQGTSVTVRLPKFGPINT